MERFQAGAVSPERQVRLLDRLRKGFLAMPRDNDIMRLFCPTGQMHFAKSAGSNFNALATVHGVVFDFFVFDRSRRTFMKRQ